MFTFILISNASKQPDIEKLIDRLGEMRREAGGRYLAHGYGGMQDGWIAIQSATAIEHDYDKDELEKIREAISNPCFFLVEGRDGGIKFSNSFVMAIDEPENFLLDNDHGLIENARSVREKIISGAEWLHSEGV